MADLKTQENEASVEGFLTTVENDRRRADAMQVIDMMRQATGEDPKMWGKSIIGFGKYDYTYASGREGTFMRIGLSPRKANLVLYLMPGYDDHADTLKRLGKHKIGKSCLYVNKLADLDLGVLRELIDASLEEMERRYPRAGSSGE